MVTTVNSSIQLTSEFESSTKPLIMTKINPFFLPYKSQPLDVVGQAE